MRTAGTCCVRALTGLLALLAISTPTAPALAEERLVMLYREKPPYSYTEQGIEKGFLLERTRQILERAGIPASFEIMPPKRIFAELETNARQVCSFGWYRIPERERYARFTLPIHRDRPHIVLAGKHSVQAVKRHKTLKSLVRDGSLAIALVDGTSYGHELDSLIAAFPGRTEKSLVPPATVARMVAARRADFMLMDHDDYDYLMATDKEFAGNGLVRIEYADMPAGLKRYILCSKSVGSATIDRLNSAISRLIPDAKSK